MNTTSLSGGLEPDKDLVFPGKPGHPEMRESISIWMYEENGRFGFPRIGIEAEAWSWEDRLYHANFAFADGRVLHQSGRGPAPSPLDEYKRLTILGAGPMTFRCIEPFQRWHFTYDGPVIDGMVSEMIDASFKSSTPSNRVRVDADLTMVTPAWVQDNSADPEGMTEQEAANAQAMGLGYRFEHHFRATGVMEIDDQCFEFSATGTRVHRQSIRNLGSFTGHCWLSALFPDGRAFSCLVYPPAEGSSEYSHNDAVIYQDGRMIPARVLAAPLLSRIVACDDDVSVVLESELGITRIAGKTLLNTFRVNNPDIGGLNLQQGGALFSWDGQQAYGMVERSRHESFTTIIS